MAKRSNKTRKQATPSKDPLRPKEGGMSLQGSYSLLLLYTFSEYEKSS